MNLISNLLARGRRNFHIAAVIILSIGIIQSVFEIDRHLSHLIIAAAYTPFSLLKNSATDLFRGASQADELRASLVEASLRLSQLEEAERENKRLRSVLGFEPPESYSIVPARVMSIDQYDLPSYAVIDRGENDSIRVNMPAINQDGLVGRVVTTSTNTAVVQLLTDPLNRVAARVSSSREMGIARFSSSGEMILTNLPVQGTVEPGDLVVSSGLGGIYPSGLLIGRVINVTRPENASFCEIRLAPAANFHSVEELFILKQDSL